MLTLKQYKRLTIVLFLPLLGLGWILSLTDPKINPREHKAINVHCSPLFTGEVECKNSIEDHDDNVQLFIGRETIKPMMVYFGFDSEKKHFFEVTASAKNLLGVVPPDPMNSAYDEEKRRYLNWLVGKEVVLATSESEFERLSNEVLDRVLLKCATVTPFKNDDFVEAECLTPSGYDKIKVVLSDQSQRYMQSVSQYLSDSSERIKKYDFNLRLKFYLISVPSMFYLYLFASLFAWVIYKGYRYVRYG